MTTETGTPLESVAERVLLVAFLVVGACLAVADVMYRRGVVLGYLMAEIALGSRFRRRVNEVSRITGEDPNEILRRWT